MILPILLASTCVATATGTNPKLKQDFEDKACADGLVAMKLHCAPKETSCTLNVYVDMNRSETQPNPLHTVRVAQIAQQVLERLRMFNTHPTVFNWNMYSKDNKSICSITIQNDSPKGDCAGAGKP